MTTDTFSTVLTCLTQLMEESRAIVRYLEEKYKGKGAELVPTDLKAYGMAEQGAYLESQTFDPMTASFLEELVFKT